MSRFFVDKKAVGDSTIEISDKDDIKHICKVLRLGVGDRIEISDSSEFEYETEIQSSDSSMIKVKILDKQRFAREPVLKVTLFQGIPKQGKMEGIIQKAVELGVNAIHPIFTERAVVTDKQNFSNKHERWKRISKEAVKQCKRGIVPEIGKILSFEEMVGKLCSYDLVLFPYEDEDERTIKDILRNVTEKPKTLAIIIGPEGGFAQKEATAVIEQGGKSVTLGKTILRTETAGPATLAMVMYELEL